MGTTSNNRQQIYIRSPVLTTHTTYSRFSNAITILNMRFSAITAVAACATAVAAAPAPGWKGWKAPAGPFDFTSTYSIKAVPAQVIGPDGPTGGLEGTTGYYELGLNSYTNTICYNITLVDFRGEYQSAALTATHLHQAPAGSAGPPRIAFPNPELGGKYANSIGCMKGPFMQPMLLAYLPPSSGLGNAILGGPAEPAGAW